jgi:hypothetical protein
VVKSGKCWNCLQGRPPKCVLLGCIIMAPIAFLGSSSILNSPPPSGWCGCFEVKPEQVCRMKMHLPRACAISFLFAVAFSTFRDLILFSLPPGPPPPLLRFVHYANPVGSCLGQGRLGILKANLFIAELLQAQSSGCRDPIGHF